MGINIMSGCNIKISDSDDNSNCEDDEERLDASDANETDKLSLVDIVVCKHQQK